MRVLRELLFCIVIVAAGSACSDEPSYPAGAPPLNPLPGHTTGGTLPPRDGGLGPQDGGGANDGGASDGGRDSGVLPDAMPGPIDAAPFPDAFTGPIPIDAAP
jgi:hypothetical protein